MTSGLDLYPPSPHMQALPSSRKTRNTVGLIALITSIIGAVFVLIPGALIFGWVLLPIAFLLSVVSLFLKNQKRGQGIAALIVSIVGTIIGFIVFFAVVTNVVEEAFNEDVETLSLGDDGEIEQSVADDETVADEDNAEAEAGSEEGSRDNPLALGTSVSESDWEVTVNSVDLCATEAVLAENPLNEDPAEGNAYIMAHITATYIGDSTDGETPWVDLEYVSPEGNSYDAAMSMIVVPDSFNSFETLYAGASTSGNFGIEVASEGVEDGTLRVAPGMFGEAVFFEVQYSPLGTAGALM